MCAGSPSPPTVRDVVRAGQEGEHKVSWTTKSFTPLTQHRILIKDVRRIFSVCGSHEITVIEEKDKSGY